MIWFTSDLHFGHAGAIKYCNRPFETVEQMNAELVRRWNFLVHPDHTIYVLGDLALCRYRDFAPIGEKLNGKKILIRGNHDSYSVGQYERCGFQVYEELKMKFAGSTVRLSHFPYALPWWKRPWAYKSELRFMDRRPPRIPGEILLHGHTHGTKQTRPNMIHVGVDAWAYYPVADRDVERLINSIKKPKIFGA
jgi:calcineurin-like phosphoesterase family protein